MLQQEIHKFLADYFQANDCAITGHSPGHLTVQLTEEIDKELMNRPFYWHYLEKTGGVPNPMSVSFITDQEKCPPDLKGEQIHLGSPRLHQIFQSAKKLSCFTRQYHLHNEGRQTPLLPWLVLNVKVSYKCDRKRDVIRSVGLQMINGRMVEEFHDRLLSIPLTPKIPDYSYTISPLIMPKSGFIRVENYLRSGIELEDHSWAEAAIARWEKDERLLTHFYEGSTEEDPESYKIEKTALREQYEPKVIISLINGGLFYLKDDAI
ncbi:YqhG family protein [Bacillus sp. FJAT-27245]|uniref:YqhG family protein n=1 Tax=Bacillus sp. FJAT-27245 TaxID=1684144 RepID=UPI0006A7BEF0|nr:YqhG family protein [Bacillus sp. FJAT-27245]